MSEDAAATEGEADSSAEAGSAAEPAEDAAVTEEAASGPEGARPPIPARMATRKRPTTPRTLPRKAANLRSSRSAAGSADALEDLREQRRSFRPRRQYKIQEVIKRGQILLVQVVKEERGNKAPRSRPTSRSQAATPS